MGVKGLWKLIESAGVPVALETLENKVLGVDVSIWLHQAVQGFRGPGGAAVANAHLLTLFHRICKLLFYRIRPVFVFDGGVPHLKKQTLASRKLKKEVATNRAKQVRERLFKNLLKSQAVRTALGKSGAGPSYVHVPKVTKKEKDLYELPPLSEALDGEAATESLEEEGNSSIVDCVNLSNLHQFDLESEEFKSLPLDVKHEILSELQGTRKQNSWGSINDMPQQSEHFAAFQMARLMKRAKFQATLDSTRDEIQKAKVSEMEVELFGELENYTSLSKRIVSEDGSHAIFVKKIKEPSKSNSETLDVESNEPNKKADKKGKGPLRKKKSIDKDFLTELAKVGIIRPDSDSDNEGNSFHIRNEGGEGDSDDGWQQCSKEEDGFLQAVGSLMEDSGLTQDEILTMIKQDQKENASFECKNESYDGPSTSANAPGNIYNPDDSSSDEDNFIEVTADVQFPRVEKEEEQKEISANNVDKLLGTKTNSLWMKIVQQKVDDMVQVSTLKTSPKKAIIDSRKIEKDNVTVKDSIKLKTKSVTVKEHGTTKDMSEPLKPVKISLDFEVKPLKMEDNIFSDIFTDLLCQPRPTITKEVIRQASQGRRQSIGAEDRVNKRIKPNPNNNSQSNIDYVDRNNSADSNLNETLNVSACDTTLPNITDLKTLHSDCTDTKFQTPLQNADIVGRNKTENYVSATDCKESSEEGEVTHDEVEIMSSSDETDDENDIRINNPSSSSHEKSIESQSQSKESKTQLENQNVNDLPQMSHKRTFPDEDSSSQPSKRKVLINIDGIKTVNLKENTPNENNQTNNSDSKSPKLPILKDQKMNDIQQFTLNSSDQTTKPIPVRPIKSLNIEHEKSTNRSQPSGSSSGDDSLIEVVGGTETGMKEKKDEQEESKISPHSFHHIDKSPETTRNNDNISGEDIGDKKGSTIRENIKQKDANNYEASIEEAKLYSDTDVKERCEANGKAEEFEVQETEVERPLDYTKDELKHLEGELASEQQALVAQAQQSERLASSINDQMYGESQHLLQLFGIPYLVAPMEAEAQCAFLNVASLTEGTITDDSDIFLFGGNAVYRNFFNQTRHVEFFKTDNIKVTLGLGQSKMITLALLCGSDYTVGVEGIGSVSAMEVLAEFPGEGIECLKNLRKWWSAASKGVSTKQYSKIRQKLTQVNIPDSFPSDSVYEAYLAPEVDESKEKFTWAVPNVEALRAFTADKFGWNCTKTDEILLPVMKKLKIKTSQKRIESYFTNIRLVKEPKFASKRMQDAIAKAKGTMLSDSDHTTGLSSTQAKTRKRAQKRKVKKDLERKQENGEIYQGCSEVTANTPLNPTPKRALLVDPSESQSVIEGRKGQKRKKTISEDGDQPPQGGTEAPDVPPRKLTKELMFKQLLEKETISQREKEKLEMQDKKKIAASILNKKMKKR